ncbi:Unknown protein, partial [Striga hermonthica]
TKLKSAVQLQDLLDATRILKLALDHIVLQESYHALSGHATDAMRGSRVPSILNS